MLRGGAIVPHAPLIALKGDAASIALADAARTVWGRIIDLDRPVVVMSSHGETTQVLSNGAGDLEAFGPLGMSVSVPVEMELAARIAAEWDKPLTDDPLDHGATGALVHAPGALEPTSPGLASTSGSGARTPEALRIVPATFAETTGPAPAGDVASVQRDAAELADVLLRVSSEIDIAVVVSAHGAASLTPRAPLTELPEGKAFDDALLDALATDNAAIVDIARDLWQVGGTCSTGPLHVWARLFGGRSSEIHAYDAPAGVGYLVAACI